MIVRLIVIVVLPILLPVVFVLRLLKEISRAPWYAWNEVRQNVAAARRVWRTKNLRELEDDF